MTPPARGSIAPWRLLALAGLLIAIGGRLELIRALGTPLPFRDQWKATAQDLLAPWVDGRLDWRAFLAPLNDHWPVLTRLWSFALTAVNGQWNNLVETAANTAVLGVGAGLFIAVIAPALGPRLGWWWTLLAGAVIALPATFENTLWGIQSLVFFQVTLSLAYLWSVATRARADGWFWLGQAAGALVLLTQQSAVLAHVAAALVLLWRLARRDGSRAVLGAGLAVAVAGIAAFAAVVPEFSVTAELRADNWRLALDLALRQLAWPVSHPGWAFLAWLPAAVFLLGRLRWRRMPPADLFLAAVALWVAAQAAAIGYGRGGDTSGFVSRYCDFLLLGWLVNAACLARLAAGAQGRARWVLGAGAALWLGGALPGFWHETFHSHAGYAFLHRADTNAANLAAVRGYLADRDPAHLARDRVGETLYTYPPAVAELLDRPGIRALLPPETGAPEARTDHGRLGGVAAVLIGGGRWFALGGAVLALGLALARRIRPASEPTSKPEVEQPWPWSGRETAVGCAALGLLTGVAWAAWPEATTFDPARRWASAHAPAREDVEFLVPRFVPLGPAVPGREPATHGAVDTLPEPVRPHWFGTRIDGDGFKGVLASQEVTVRRRWASLPVSGWVNWSGNAVRWQLRHPDTGEERWVDLSVASPQRGFAVHTRDFGEFAGWRASIVLFDGRDDAAGWVGVAAAAFSDDADFGRQWQSRLRGERAETTHRLLAALTGLALGAALLLGIPPRRRNRIRP